MHLVITFLLTILISCECSEIKKEKSVPRFEVEYQWTFINFTWDSQEVYNEAIDTEKYIPKNSAMAGIKFYKDKFYIAMPRICNGTPVTLGYFSTKSQSQNNPEITPFPDWDTNDLTNHTCDKLENVQSMEIDADGIMWVIDGFRVKPDSKCPPKLVLYDLNDNNKIVQTYIFPEQISLSKGGFLNDIVIDNTDGGFAYITDHSSIDPGLVIYSKEKNHAWKIRDASMFAQTCATDFAVEGSIFNQLAPIDGIALSPAGQCGSKCLYYCALAGLDLYSISTDVLKNEEICAGGDWRFNVTHVGQKQAQSDGMVVDNQGNLYYGLIPLYGVGKWNTHEDFSKAVIVDTNNSTMVWTDSFSFDDKGNLYLLANHINEYFVGQCNFKKDEGEKVFFRILKYYTGTRNYLH